MEDDLELKTTLNERGAFMEDDQPWMKNVLERKMTFGGDELGWRTNMDKRSSWMEDYHGWRTMEYEL